jgi:hypothetical protein
VRTNVYLTIDTENSMGGAWGNSSFRPVGADRRIYCYIDGKSHGIGWICRELNARNLKATFFAEVFGALIFGEDETREWFQYLLEQGQDVQLHTHLSFYFFSQRAAGGQHSRAPTDNLADIEGPLRGELLEHACEIFRRMAGYDPIVYRAGNWRMDRELLQDLKAKGIVLDTSFNRALQGSGSFDEGLDSVNALQLVEGMWELPVTVAHQRLPVDSVADGLRAITATSLSCWELRKVLDDSHASGTTHICIAFHSFNGVKPKDVQYTEMKPDRIVQRRFEFLLDYLAANQDRFHVSTVGDLARQLQSSTEFVDSRASVARLGLLHPLARKLVQGMNSIYY